MRRAALIAAFVCCTAPAFAQAPVWRDARWTPPIDNWGTGLAYVCDNEACPGGVTLLARTKVGFCNCFSGVADDDEIDRIGDVDLHGDTYKPAEPGQVTAVGPLAGRKRAFQARSRWLGISHVVSIVVATDCKAVVATLVSSAPITPSIEIAALALLGDKPFQKWAAAQ